MDIDRYLRAVGTPVEVRSPDGTVLGRANARISPLRYKNKMYLNGIYTNIGFNSEGHYLYIGTPDTDLTAVPDGSYISAGSVNYRIDRSEKMTVGPRTVYIWAIIRVMVAPSEVTV